MTHQKCFYCEKNISTRDRYIKVYKIVQRFSQEKIKYVQFTFPIRVCEKCSKNEKENRRILTLIARLSIVIFVGLSSYRVYHIVTIIKPPVREIVNTIFEAILMSFIFSLALLAGLSILFTIISLVFKRDTEIKTSSHPFFIILKKYHWYLKIPHPKYDTYSKDVLKSKAQEHEIFNKQNKYLVEAENLFQAYSESLNANKNNL